MILAEFAQYRTIYRVLQFQAERRRGRLAIVALLNARVVQLCALIRMRGSKIGRYLACRFWRDPRADRTWAEG